MCIACKGSRNLCQKGYCELLGRVRKHMSSKTLDTKEVFGSSPPSVFVGRYGYPKVSIGPMLPPERIFKAERLDDPREWWGLGIEEVVGIRGSLLRSKVEQKVSSASTPDRHLAACQELSLSSKAVDTEVLFQKKPRINFLSFDNFTAPVAPGLDMEKMRLTQNPSVPRKVDAVTSDTDVLAADGLWELYDGNVDLTQMQRLMSAGLLGEGRKRLLVPTRWSITAVDDVLGKKLMEKVRYLPQLGEVLLYRGDYAGNYFWILLVPRAWSFGMTETWMKGSFWSGDASTDTNPSRTEHTQVGAGSTQANRNSNPLDNPNPPGNSTSTISPGNPNPSVTSNSPNYSNPSDGFFTTLSDSEGFAGRTGYADRVTGAYYAARLGVLEHLIGLKRQATALIYREITHEYWLPLGVWVIRETVRKALEGRPERFDTLNSAMSRVTAHATNKKGVFHSEFVRSILSQRTLDDF